MASKSEVVQARVTTVTRPSIFISYSRRNVDYVDRLVRSLEGLGFDCWVDRQDLEGGTTWREKISLSIRKCQAFVLVISPDSMNSPIVAQEVSLAEFHGRTIIPVMYEVCELPPGIDLQIHKLHWVDFAVNQYDDAMVQLETALWAATNTRKDGAALTQRRLNAWRPWVGFFYLLSGVYYLAAILLFVGGWHAIFSADQLHFLGGLSDFDRVLWVSIALLHVAGAFFLLRLWHLVVGIFLTDWCVYTVYVVQDVVLNAPVEFPTATLVSYGVFSLAVWYVWQLRKANLLSSSSNSRTGKESEEPREEGVAFGLDKTIKKANIPKVMEKLSHR